jgi:hypothetical protein
MNRQGAHAADPRMPTGGEAVCGARLGILMLEPPGSAARPWRER